MKDLIKKILTSLGFDTHAYLFGVLERNATRICNDKIGGLDETKKALVLAEDERFHHKDVITEDVGSQQVVRGFTIDRIRFLETCGIRAGETVMDIGDSNGIFLRSLDKDGISLNISPRVASALHEKGLQTVIADAEHMPFKDTSISTILLFQTLEHVPNPVLLLNEIGRVCKDSLVLSIPYVKQTHIHRRLYEPRVPLHEHHIFEFSPGDFRSVVSHTPFRIERESTAVVLDKRGISLDRLVISAWNRFVEPDHFCGCFMKFHIVYLKKRGTDEENGKR